LGNASVNYFNFDTGHWRNVGSLVSTYDSERFVKVIMDNKNNKALFFWTDASQFFSRHFDMSSGSWESEEKLISNQAGAVGYSDSGQVVLDKHGNALATWRTIETPGGASTYSALWSNRFNANDATWGIPQLIIDEGVEDIISSSFEIVSNANGDALLQWALSGGAIYFVIRFDAEDNSWGNIQETLEGAISTPAPKMAINDNGDGFIFSGILFFRFDATTDTWNITLADDVNASPLDIIADDKGNALMIFLNNGDIWSRQYDAQQGVWQDAELVWEKSEFGSLMSLQLVTDKNSRVLAMWMESVFIPDSDNRIWGSRFNFDTGWGNTELIGNDGIGNGPSSFDEQIVIAPNGNAFISWTEFGSSGWEVWSNHFK